MDLGRLDPGDGATRHIALGEGSRPHGVIVGPEGDPWINDGGLNAIVRVDADTEEVHAHPLPAERSGADLNTAAFDGDGNDDVWLTDFGRDLLWRFDPDTESFEAFAPPSQGAQMGQLLGRPGEVWGAGSAVDTLVVVRLP